MKREFVLYNPNAGEGEGRQVANQLSVITECKEFHSIDMTVIMNYSDFLFDLTEDDKLVICGGDGTLNRFVNDTAGINIKSKVFYYPCGNGNDFSRDLDANEESFPIDVTDYINDLPSVVVNGKEYKFINGVGFGIDGYCCEEGDRLKKIGKKPNYTAIAVSGLLTNYKPTRATVTVDGQRYNFQTVWLAPTMNGKYYGGGMMPTPWQQRKNENGEVSVMIFHGCGRLKTLCIFPSIFSGAHIKKTKNVTILKGKEIRVEFDSPRSIQIDGETVVGVTKYTVKGHAFIGKY